MFATSLSRQNFQDTIETHIWYKHEGKVRLLLFLFSFPCTNFHLNRINCLYFLCFRNFKTRGFLLLFFPSEEFSFSLNNYATIFTYLFVLVIISRIVEFRIGKQINVIRELISKRFLKTRLSRKSTDSNENSINIHKRIYRHSSW